MKDCEICGVRGKPDDLVRCQGCGNSFHHWYCFHVLVGDSLEAKCAWRCEDCASRNTKVGPSPCRKSDRIKKANEDKVKRKKRLIKRGVSSVRSKIQVDRSPEVLEHPLEEKARKPPICDQSRKIQEPRKQRNLFLVGDDEHGHETDQASQLDSTAIGDSPTRLCAQHIKAHVADHAEPQVIPIRRSPETKQLSSDKVKTASSSACDLSRGNQRSIKPRRKLVLEDMSEHESVKSQGNEEDTAIIENPIWRGYFRSARFVARLSSKASERVQKESTALPEEYLELEIFRRSEVWPQRFRRSAPNEENIALYFFPEPESVAEYKELLDKMDKLDVAVKTHIKVAELVIVSSRELPSENQKLFGDFYLWGV